jgi:TonB family protein
VRVVTRRQESMLTEDDRERWLVLALAALFSIGVHVGITTGLGLIDVESLAIAPPPPTEFTIETSTVAEEEEIVEEEEPEPEEEEPEPEPEPEIEDPEPEVIRAPEPNDPAPEPPPQAEEPPPPEPLDLSGTVLTGTGDSSFTVVQGDGSDREGPIGPPPTRRTGSPDGVPGGTGGGGMGTGSGPRVLPLADLSRRPSPPDTTSITRCLQSSYPEAARNQGLEGVARVRGRVMPDGSFSRVRIASESVRGQGFGQTCLRCLRGKRWTPPLGPDGNPVATEVTFSCDFQIR